MAMFCFPNFTKILSNFSNPKLLNSGDLSAVTGKFCVMVAILESFDCICIPANHPDLIGIVPIFEFENLKKSVHSDFQEEKRCFLL